MLKPSSMQKSSVPTAPVVSPVLSAMQMIQEAAARGSRVEGAQVEVEVRFDGVTVGIFERIKAHFLKIANGNQQVIDTTDYYINTGGSRHRHTLSALVNDARVDNDGEPDVTSGQYQSFAIVKNEIWSHKNDEWGVKIAVATEKAVPEEIVSSAEAYEASAFLVRNKHRTRFPFYNGKIWVDLTQVVVAEEGSKAYSKWEIECEINDTITEQSIRRLDATVNMVLGLYQDTLVLYTNTERTMVIKDFNRILGAQPSNVLRHDVMVQARNLKRKDCVYGGLIGNRVGYTITPKAEGHRKLLMIHETGIWLLFPPLEMTRITSRDAALAPLWGTILDGENITAARRQGEGLNIKSTYYYLPFDTMAYKGSNTMQKKTLFERLEYRDIIVSRFPKDNPKITIGRKDFTPLGSTPEEVQNAVKMVKHGLPHLPYKTDGYMVTPIESEYNPHSDSYPLHKRCLTKYPDICKLKEWEQLTTDYYLEWVLGKEAPGNLLVGRRIHGRSQLVPFTGSDFNPFDPATQVEWSHPMLKGLGSGTIVEFGPYHDGAGNIMVRPIQVRVDKVRPNTEEIAVDIWDDINNPFTVDTLEGNTFALLFQSHTSIKRHLFAAIPADIDLVDIGYGRGGDLSKQRHLHKILGVEPDPDNARECLRRANLRAGSGEPMINRLRLEICGGEETHRIVTAAIEHFGWKDGASREVHIVMMLSLSFFWKSKQLFRSLVETIHGIKDAYRKAGGTKDVSFTFMTIEGHATKALIDERGPNFTLGPSSFRFTPPNHLHINIEDSIVTEQDEYLVYLEDLQIAGGLVGMSTEPATKERFLFPNEMTFTKLYVSGTAKVGDMPDFDGSRDPFQGTSFEHVVDDTPQLDDVAAPDNPIPQLDALSIQEQPIVLIPTVSLPVDTSSLASLCTGDDATEVIATAIANPNVQTTMVTPPPGYFVRVATIHDGNSFLHSVLKATMPRYNRMGLADRVQTAATMRKQICDKLSQVNADNFPTEQDVLDTLTVYKGVDPRSDTTVPLNSYYYTLENGGVYKTMASMFPSMCGLWCLQQYLQANHELSHMMYTYVAELLGVNINIYGISRQGIALLAAYPAMPPRKYLLAPQPKDPWKCPTICILENSGGNTVTYEPIGFRTSVRGPITLTYDSTCSL